MQLIGVFNLKTLRSIIQIFYCEVNSKDITYSINNFILTKRSHVNNPPILTQKQPKVAIFDKTDFLGLKTS